MPNLPSHHERESQDGSQCGCAQSIQQHYTVDSSLAPRIDQLTAPFLSSHHAVSNSTMQFFIDDLEQCCILCNTEH